MRKIPILFAMTYMIDLDHEELVQFNTDKEKIKYALNDIETREFDLDGWIDAKIIEHKVMNDAVNFSIQFNKKD